MSLAKTLIVLSPGFPKNESDSTCLPSLQVFLKKLKNLHPEINVIVIAFHYPFISKKYNWNGITVISFNGGNRGTFFRRFLWFRIWRTLQIIVKENNIMGILSFWLGECALIGKWLSSKYKIRHLIWLLGQDAKMGNKYFRRVNPKTKDLIAISDYTSDVFYVNYSIRPAHTIPVGIDPDIFPKKDNPDSIDIMGAGSLILLKQFSLFIEVIQSLVQEYPLLKSIICGKGPEKEKLKHQIEANDLEKNISLLDELPHMEVLRLMQISKIFLHTSEYEGFSTVCLEALCAGAQVVSVVKPMNRDIEHFYLAKDKDEIIKIIDHLLRERSRPDPVMPYLVGDTVNNIMRLYHKT